jgi:hypothetical protein
LSRAARRSSIMVVMDSTHDAAALAVEDPPAQDARERLGRALAPALAGAGQVLWLGGWMIGGDRVARRSPFGFGSDATVGLATVAQIGGSLVQGIISLLDVDNKYAAFALLRQMVEVEYLAWAFAEDEEEAANWMRSTREQRMKMWQPRHLRQRSGGLFQVEDYARHCDFGGHPAPESRSLLPDHKNLGPHAAWKEVARHGASTWEYIEAAATRLGYGSHLAGAALVALIENWRAIDPTAWPSRVAPATSA